MASIAPIPPLLGARIKRNTLIPIDQYSNPNSIYNNYDIEWRCTLTITPLTVSQEPNFVFDANDIQIGNWFLQTSGLSFMITSIISVNSATELDVSLKDIDLYNILSAPTQDGIINPDNTYGVIFSLNENGQPNLTYLTFLTALQDVSYWINDAIGRFSYRNYMEDFYMKQSLSTDYSFYTIDQVVFIGQQNGIGSYKFLPVDSRSSIQCDKAFGIVSSVNQPELGNMYVRPFGRAITQLPFNLPGNIGDVLYYDYTNPPSYCTNIKPISGIPIRKYIKLSSNIASVLYGPDTSGLGITGITGPTGPTGPSTTNVNLDIDDSYHANTINVSLGLQPVQIVSTIVIINQPCGVWTMGTIEFRNLDSVRHTVSVFIEVDGQRSQMLSHDVFPAINSIGGIITMSVQKRGYCPTSGIKNLTIYAQCDTNNGLVRCTHFDIFAIGDL